jgi:ribose-phosphate pyrophosphokinase
MSKLLLLENTQLSKEVEKEFKDILIQHLFSTFKDGEMFIELLNPVRGEDVIILCSICEPVNDNLMKVLISCDALKRASAKSITLITPYLGYSRQDRKTKPRQPITSKLVADLLQTAGVNRIITCDLHANQIEGFYNIPLDNIPILRIFGSKWNHMYNKGDMSNYTVVSPDHGGILRTKSFAEEAGIPNMVIINKYREKANEVAQMQVIGNVEGKDCIIIDDLVDTGGTLIKSTEELKKLGAKDIYVYCTHGVLSGDAIDKLSNCSNISKLFISNSIDKSSKLINNKINYIDISKVIIALINNFNRGGSLHSCITSLLR